MTLKDYIPTFKAVVLLSVALGAYYWGTKGIVAFIESYVPTETVSCVSTAYSIYGGKIKMAIDCQGHKEKIADAEIIAALLMPGVALQCTRFVSETLERTKIKCSLTDKVGD